MPATVAAFSSEAEHRLRQPRTRGMFEPIDAARRQLGLLTVADDQGQMRIYWLIDLETRIISDARFLAFGDRSSHPIGDAFTESVRGLSLDTACRLSPEQIESKLRDDPRQPAFGEDGLDPLRFLPDLQAKALAAFPLVRLLPKPIEVERYERKRQQDWDEQDRIWLPLSLLKKLALVQKTLNPVLTDRLNRPDLQWSVEGLHEDFQLKIKLTDVPAEERPTILQFFVSELRQRIHPQITVEEV